MKRLPCLLPLQNSEFLIQCIIQLLSLVLTNFNYDDYINVNANVTDIFPWQGHHDRVVQLK